MYSVDIGGLEVSVSHVGVLTFSDDSCNWEVQVQMADFLMWLGVPKGMAEQVDRKAAWLSMQRQMESNE